MLRMFKGCNFMSTNLNLYIYDLGNKFVDIWEKIHLWAQMLQIIYKCFIQHLVRPPGAKITVAIPRWYEN